MNPDGKGNRGHHFRKNLERWLPRLWQSRQPRPAETKAGLQPPKNQWREHDEGELSRQAFFANGVQKKPKTLDCRGDAVRVSFARAVGGSAFAPLARDRARGYGASVRFREFPLFLWAEQGSVPLCYDDSFLFLFLGWFCGPAGGSCRHATGTACRGD